MKQLKKICKEIFIDGLSGMATGLFATLIIGTIIQQVGKLIPGTVGELLFLMGKAAGVITGAGIGVGVAARLKASPLTCVSAAASGMIGAFASKIIAGTMLVDGTIVLAAELSPDTSRLWDAKTGEKLDKDRFRRDMGGVEEAYAEIMSRLEAHL